jgi:hypothetical protein
MYNIATKKRLKLGKTTVRGLSDQESAMVGGGDFIDPATLRTIPRIPVTPRPNPLTTRQSLVCSVTPSNPPPGGMPPTGGSTQLETAIKCVTQMTQGVCGSQPSICLCVPTRNSYECR